MEARYCPVCGAERWPGAAFCGRCRYPFASELGAPSGSPETPAPDGPTKPPLAQPVHIESEPIEPTPSESLAAPPEVLEAAVLCARCGTPREGGGWFCGACGAAFADAPEPHAASIPAGEEGRARAGGRRVAAVLAGLVVVLVLVVAGVAGISMLTNAGATPVPSNDASVPSATAGATSQPTQPPASANTIATATPTVPATPVVWKPEDLTRLVGYVPESLTGCTGLEPASSGELDRSPVAIAAIECRLAAGEVNAADVARVAYELLPTWAAADSWYSERLDSAAIGRDQNGCWNGLAGEVDYSFGRVACWIDSSSSLATIVWSDDRVAVVGSATGPSEDLQGLVDGWWNSAMLIPEASGADLTQDEQAVLDQVPAPLLPKCHPYRTIELNSSDPVGDVGAIQCDINAAKILDVTWFEFTSPAALDAWFERRVGDIAGQSTSVGCRDRVAGATTWEHGRVICYRSTSNDARIRWTDDRSMTYGVINSSGSDVSALETWWRADALS